QRPDELVVDAAARSPEHLVQVGEMLPGAYEERSPADAEPAEQAASDCVVGAAEDRDQNSRQDEGGRGQPVGGEPVAGAEPECKRNEDDEQERRNDSAEIGRTSG